MCIRDSAHTGDKQRADCADRRDENRHRVAAGNLRAAIFKIVAVLFVTLFALICLYPLMMVVSVSFSNETEVLLNGYSVFRCV